MFRLDEEAVWRIRNVPLTIILSKRLYDLVEAERKMGYAATYYPIVRPDFDFYGVAMKGKTGTTLVSLPFHLFPYAPLHEWGPTFVAQPTSKIDDVVISNIELYTENGRRKIRTSDAVELIFIALLGDKVKNIYNQLINEDIKKSLGVDVGKNAIDVLMEVGKQRMEELEKASAEGNPGTALMKWAQTMMKISAEDPKTNIIPILSLFTTELEY